MHNISKRHSIEPLEIRIAPAGLSDFPLNNLNGNAGFNLRVTGVDTLELGVVSSAGDANGDGIDDLLLAFPADNNGTGVVALLFGRDDGFPGAVEIAQIGNNGTGVLIFGEQTSDNFGTAVAGAGDVNGDGIDDIIVGAPGQNAGGTDRGAAYVIFGRESWPGTVNASGVNGTDGFKLTGAANFDRLGEVVGGAFHPNNGHGGDFNADGFNDIIVGAPDKDLLASSGGAAYVVFGKDTAYTPTVSASTLTGTTGFAIGSSLVGEDLGSAVSLAGDLNGDGFDDIVVGEFIERAETDSDRGFVIFGRSSGISATVDANALQESQGYVVDDTEEEDFGSMPQLFDADGDGDLDFFTIYQRFDPKKGNFVIGYAIAKNKGDGFEGNPFENGSRKELRRVVEVPNNFSANLDFGDFDGDGFPDIVIDTGETPRANLYLGKNAKGLSLMRVEKDDGYAFVGLDTGNEFDNSVNFIGDINGDGLDDLLVRPPQGSSADKAYVVYGTDLELKKNASSVSYTDIDGDIVTIKTSKGSLDFNMFQFSTPDGAVEGGRSLDGLDFTFAGQTFSGANITVSVKKAKGGDGLVNVGAIDATGIDLGKVKIKGSLGVIDSGDADFDDVGLKSLDVDSFGSTDGGPVGNSDIRGGIGSIKVKKDWTGAGLNVTGNGDSGVGSISIGGDFEGEIAIAGALGSFKSGDIAENSGIVADGSSSKKTSITARVIGDGTSIQLATAISKLAAKQIGSATIEADRIDSLTVSGDKKGGLAGDFAADLTLVNDSGTGKTKALGSAKIAGTVSGSLISVAGSVGSFTAAAILDSSIFVGFTPTTALDPFAGGTFLDDALLGKFILDGKSALGGDVILSDDSFVIATEMGSVSLTAIDSTEGTLVWGFGYRDDIKGLKVKDPAFTYDTKAGLTQSEDDFSVVQYIS